MDAVSRESTPMAPPVEQRRTVDFRRDVMPIIQRKCAKCHREDKNDLRLDGGLQAVAMPDTKARFNRAYVNLLSPSRSDDRSGSGPVYVNPLSARTSPVIWRLFGRKMYSPTDATSAAAGRPVKQMPPEKADPLTDDEKRTFAEWIDMGALWDGIPGPDRFSSENK